MAKTVRLTLGDILLKEGFIKEEDIEKAREYQRTHGGNLSESFVKLGLVKEEQVIIGLAEQLGIPYIKLNSYKLDLKIMKIIPEKIIREKKVVPLSRSGNTLTVTMADPLNVLLIDDLKTITGCKIQTVVSTPSEIEETIANFFASLTTEDLEKLIKQSKEEVRIITEKETVDLDKAIRQAEEAPIINIVNSILSRSIKERASDIHFEPFEKEIRIRYRIDGILYPAISFPKKVQNAVISRVKILSEMDIAEHRIPQDGRFKVKVRNRDINFRVSTIPTRFGEKVVMRLLDKAQLMGLTIDKLGLEKNILEKYERAIKQPYGMIVLTGPTSCGKSTTLYAALKAISTPDKNILTIEDPVEYEAEGINQVQVYEEIGLTFPKVLRAFLRQDPDVIMVGEMRDSETADIGIKAALTGHLLFTTLHTNNAPTAISRLINMEIEPFLLADALTFVGAQRLMRKVCKNCRTHFEPSPQLLKSLNIKSGNERIFYKAKGCELCNNTGYRGRIAVMEALEINDEIRELIIRNASESKIREAAINNGMVPLRENALVKVFRGETTLKEMVRVAGA